MQMLLNSLNLELSPQSIVNSQDVEYGLIHSMGGFQLAVLAPNNSKVPDAFKGEFSEIRDRTLIIGSLSPRNATSIRTQLPFLQPKPFGKAFDIEGFRLVVDEPDLLRAVVECGRTIAHVASMYEHMQRAVDNRLCEVGVFMDETNLPTSPAEHVYIASELRQQGVFI